MILPLERDRGPEESLIRGTDRRGCLRYPR